MPMASGRSSLRVAPAGIRVTDAVARSMVKSLRPQWPAELVTTMPWWRTDLVVTDRVP